MTVRYQQGYKPIQTSETTALDALSVRFAKHMEDNINHTIVALSPKLVSQVWPEDIQAQYTDGWLLGVWGPFVIPRLYDVISWTVNVDSTGDKETLYLRCGDQMPVQSDAPITDEQKYGNYDEDTISLADDPGVTIRENMRTLEIRRNDAGESWISLAIQASDAISSIRVITLDVTAEHSAAY